MRQAADAAHPTPLLVRFLRPGGATTSRRQPGEEGCGRPGTVPEMAPSLGLSFDRQYPAAFVAEMAEALEARGIDQLWVIEDCFYTAGISLAATALARSRRLQVGLGILPVAGGSWGR